MDNIISDAHENAVVLATAVISLNRNLLPVEYFHSKYCLPLIKTVSIMRCVSKAKLAFKTVGSVVMNSGYLFSLF